MPIEAFVLDHAKTDPAGTDTKFGGVIVVPGHTTIGLKGPTVATGCTMIVVVTGVPGQPFEVGVKTKLTV